MSFRKRRVLMMTPLYIIFEFFLLKYLFLLIYPLDDLTIALMALILGLMNVVSMLLELKKSRFITRLLTEIFAIWIWASMMYLIELVIIYSVSIFFQLDHTLILIILALVPIIGVYAYWKAHNLVVNERTIELDNLTKEVNVVHLSDVHFGAVRYKKIIRQLADMLKTLEDSCEVAIISGDMADGSSVVLEDDFMPLSEVNMPIIFTPGNHDYYIGLENVKKACRKAGIIVLDNESTQIGDLNIYGLAYSFDDINTPDIGELKGEIKNDKINIMIYHVPYLWEEHSKAGFDIQLSGHTHGGQFHPATWFCRLLYGYNRGLFKDERGHYMHVTTGVGSMDQPMRWGTDSEVVILRLKHALV